MILKVEFDDRDYSYEVPIEKILPYLKISEEDILNAVREALKQ